MEARQLLRVGPGGLSQVQIALSGAVLIAAALVAGLLWVPSAASERNVTVTERSSGGTRPCPPVQPKPWPVDGGCEFRLEDNTAGFRVLTPFGGMAFGRDCRMYAAVHAAADGAMWLENIEVAGDNPCPDIRPCEYGKGYESPWKSQIRATEDGDSVLHVPACIDSCMGWFQAPIELTLETKNGFLRAIRADKVVLGDTGLELDVRMVVDRRDIKIEPTGDEGS